MKRIISLVLLLAILFLGVEWLVTFFTKSYEITYTISNEDKKVTVVERYEKENNDTYDIEIKYNDSSFLYGIPNNYNKQKKIIKGVEIFNNNDDICIYPILKDNKELYVECLSNGELYTAYSYYDNGFIQSVYNTLNEKGYKITQSNNIENIKAYNNGTLYQSNLPDTDTIVLWQYKGIVKINSKKEDTINTMSFDKFENNLGVLVDKYYVVPDYISSKLLEFSNLNVINVDTGKKEKVSLGYSLSSDTYINGVIDNKIYYTDPSNLQQIEYNVKNKKTRLIGNVELGGQMYDGKWNSVNIYDFRSSQIKFKDYKDLDNYTYSMLRKGDSSYYFYQDDGKFYQVPINHQDKKILLFTASNINNFILKNDDIYYVSGNTLYYFNINNGLVPVFVNNDLIYNTLNRVSIYRK